MNAQEVHEVLSRFRLPPVLEEFLPTLPGDDFARPDDERETDTDLPFAWARDTTT